MEVGEVKQCLNNRQKRTRLKFTDINQPRLWAIPSHDMYTHKLPLYSECRRTHAKLEKLYTTSYSRESYYIVPRRVLSHAPRINNYLRPRERKHSRKQHNTVGEKKKSLSLFLKKQIKKKPFTGSKAHNSPPKLAKPPPRLSTH